MDALKTGLRRVIFLIFCLFCFYRWQFSISLLHDLGRGAWLLGGRGVFTFSLLSFFSLFWMMAGLDDLDGSYLEAWASTLYSAWHVTIVCFLTPSVTPSRWPRKDLILFLFKTHFLQVNSSKYYT
ncbi:hypothetical protein F5884DRAFT_21532 [Xylogone sp. PMI_703]|nr:hypothetical protein F5884DRAFT_21532 [Xylogone sp. PMI_703]